MRKNYNTFQALALISSVYAPKWTDNGYDASINNFVTISLRQVEIKTISIAAKFGTMPQIQFQVSYNN